MLVIFRLSPKIRVAVAALVGLLFQASIAYSNTSLPSLEITTDDKVIYCSVGPISIDEGVKQALNEGTAATFIWQISIKEVNDYWFNESVGNITFVRQAIPDLISKSWLLSDSSSGISERVYHIDEVIRFLSRLEQFPALDQSLLLSGVVYNFHIKLHAHEGELRDSWWRKLMRFSDTVAQKTVTLP